MVKRIKKVGTKSKVKKLKLSNYGIGKNSIITGSTSRSHGIGGGGSVSVENTGTRVFGDATVDGSLRLLRDETTNTIKVQRLESQIWETKGEMAGSFESDIFLLDDSRGYVGFKNINDVLFSMLKPSVDGLGGVNIANVYGSRTTIYSKDRISFASPSEASVHKEIIEAGIGTDHVIVGGSPQSFAYTLSMSPETMINIEGLYLTADVSSVGKKINLCFLDTDDVERTQHVSSFDFSLGSGFILEEGENYIPFKISVVYHSSFAFKVVVFAEDGETATLDGSATHLKLDLSVQNLAMDFNFENGGTNAKGFGTQFMKVSDNTFEDAVVGTEYYSPNQHGGIYGQIYRQYFGSGLTSTNPRIDTGSIVTGMIDYATQFTYAGDPRGMGHGNVTAYGDSDNHLYLQLSGSSGGGNISVNAISYVLVRGWVDYTK